MIGRCTRPGVRPAAGLGVLALTLLAAGCGRGTGNVSGTVKFNGRPLTAGTISFFDPDNRVSSSPIKPDGTYTVTGVRTGRAKIAVAVPLSISFAPSDVPGAKAMTVPQSKAPPIPPRYLDPEQSGLTCDVHTGDQTHEVDLKP